MTCLPAQVIQHHPPRAQTEQRIADLELRLTSLLESRRRREKRLELRRRQFHVLLTSIHRLQGLLSREEGEKEGEDPGVMDTS